MNTPENKRALSITEFAVAYGVGRSTVYAEIRGGRLATFKCGRRRLVSVESAKSWRRDRESETATASAS